MAGKIINVGLIGCGEVAQIIHIPTLNYMSSFFRIVHLCDTSPSALAHCAQKVIHASPKPKTTAKAQELCQDPDVDVVFVLSSDEFHVSHAVMALEQGKTVFIEKPMVMNARGLEVLREAERASKGTVMVGYMRRYARAFIDAVAEIGGMDQICYAVVRDIIGKNAFFTAQSGAFPAYFSDYPEEAKKERAAAVGEMFKQSLEIEMGVEVTEESRKAWSTLGSLGSHDLSAMREALGMPRKVLGCSLEMGRGFWNALFQYDGFTVHYESGIHEVPIFDAFIEVFSRTKRVKVKYDTPFVKGLPITMTVLEDVDGSGALKETTIRKTYEDAYTLEMRELYALMTEGKSVKTTVEDAGKDLEIFQMIMKASHFSSKGREA